MMDSKFTNETEESSWDIVARYEALGQFFRDESSRLGNGGKNDIFKPIADWYEAAFNRCKIGMKNMNEKDDEENDDEEEKSNNAMATMPVTTTMTIGTKTTRKKAKGGTKSKSGVAATATTTTTRRSSTNLLRTDAALDEVQAALAELGLGM